MIKKCFTINQNRTTLEFKEYEKLIKDGLFQAVEIFYPYDKTKEQLETYTNNVYNLMKYNIEVVLHLPHGYRSDLLNEDTYDVVIQRFKDAIDYARKFNVKKLTLHLGSAIQNNERVDRNILIDKCIKNIQILSDYCYPMNLMIENMPGDNELGYSPQEIKYLIEKSNRNNVKFILDFGHANVSCYTNEEYINVLKPYLMHLHISDNDTSTDQHKPIGCGNIDFVKLFKMIDFYNELYCLEIIYKDHNDLIEYEKNLMSRIFL